MFCPNDKAMLKPVNGVLTCPKCGYTKKAVAGENVADFLSAGFTPEQYELLVASTHAAPQLRTIGGEVLA